MTCLPIHSYPYSVTPPFSHTSICPPTHPSTKSPIHPHIHPPNHPSIYNIHSSTHPNILLSTHPSVHLVLWLSLHSYTPSIYLSIHSFMHPSILHPSIFHSSFIHSSSIHPSTHPQKSLCCGPASSTRHTVLLSPFYHNLIGEASSEQTRKKSTPAGGVCGENATVWCYQQCPGVLD